MVEVACIVVIVRLVINSLLLFCDGFFGSPSAERNMKAVSL